MAAGSQESTSPVIDRQWWAHVVGAFPQVVASNKLTISKNQIEEVLEVPEGRAFLANSDASAEPVCSQPSPDVAETLRNSHCGSGLAGAVVGAF